MKIFSRDRLIEDLKKEGVFNTMLAQQALNTWVRKLDGQQVKNGRVGSFKVKDAWCIDIEQKKGDVGR
jgi:hypothetical protein